MWTHRDTADSDANREITASIQEAGVGREALFADLVALSAVEVSVARGTAGLTVTLPVPAESLRARLTEDLRDAVSAVEGISTVEITWTPKVPDPGERVDLVPGVKNVLAVASGKGGVGKSTVAANMAVALADAGAAVGLLDADIYGPNAPAMLGISERTPRTTSDNAIVPWEIHGVKVMSMGFVTGEDDPVIWRGPMVDDALEQLFRDVHWGELDYLLVDLPPGTGDAQISLVQHLPVTGAIVITTPQGVAIDNARRGLQGFARYDLPVLGIAENMAGFECPDCGTEHDVFDSGGADGLSDEFDVPVLGHIPIDMAIGRLDDESETDPPGVSIPVLGRLQLPRTREQRERSANLAPVALREESDATREAIRLLATRTAAQIQDLIASKDVFD